MKNTTKNQPENKPATSKQSPSKPPAEPQQDDTLQCKILQNRLLVNGAYRAKNSRIRLTAAQARPLESAGKLQILGN